MELLFGEPYGLVAVGGVLQDREEGSDLRDRGYPDALCRRGVYGHPSGTVTVIEQDLGEQAAPECPMMIGGLSSSPMMFSRCSTTPGMVTASIGEGSSLSASTSTSKPG